VEKVDAEDPEAAKIAALLGRCEAELRAAHFEQALASAGEVRDRIDARKGTADDPGRVRLEIATATAYVALGQNDAALESLERALIADPDLELDPALTSPKVLAVFRVARGRATPAR
jgi:thioredoxin-like negative regulator of GroEL